MPAASKRRASVGQSRPFRPPPEAGLTIIATASVTGSLVSPQDAAEGVVPFGSDFQRERHVFGEEITLCHQFLSGGTNPGEISLPVVVAFGERGARVAGACAFLRRLGE